MRIREWKTLLAAGMILASTAYGSTSFAAMPQGDFACKVRAQGGKIGLVLVQAEAAAEAREAALVAEALTTDNSRARATRVVQCIRLGEERFTDYQFQQFLESLPM